MGAIAQLMASQKIAAGGSALLTNLISYWNMDEASGTRADSTATGNTLTDNNTVGSATGKISNAGDFEVSASEYLSHADNTSLSIGDTSFTLTAWVNLESKAASMVIMSKDSSVAPDREYLFWYNSGSDRFELLVFNAAGTSLSIAADALGSPSTSTWYYVVAWFDTSDDIVRIQVNDGTVNASSASAGFTPADGAESFKMGAWVGGILTWDGLIDEVGFWKRTLTAQERTDLYNSGNALAYPF